MGGDAAGEGEGAFSPVWQPWKAPGDPEHLSLLQLTWAIPAGLLGSLCCPQPGAAPLLCSCLQESIPDPPGPRWALRAGTAAGDGVSRAGHGEQGTHLSVPTDPLGLEATVSHRTRSRQRQELSPAVQGKIFPPSHSGGCNPPTTAFTAFFRPSTAPAILGCGEKAALMFYVTCK